MLGAIHQFTSWAGLTFSPGKCASLTCINCTSHRYVDTFSPLLGDHHIPPITWEQHYCYLGCEMGANPKQEAAKVGECYARDCQKLLRSGLTDWQKMDAIHRFIRPTLNHIIRTTLPARSWAQKLDKQVRRAAKINLRLPLRTADAFLYVSQRDGGLGMPCIEEAMDVARSVSAAKLLSSNDPLLRGVVMEQLKVCTKKRLGIPEPTRENVCDFINHPPPEGEGAKGDIRSLWNLVRSSLHKCRARIHPVASHRSPTRTRKRTFL